MESGVPMDEVLSLFQLNNYVRRAIDINFPEPVWINAEISSAKNVRGHWYLELVEKSSDSDELLAKSRATLWVRNYHFLKHRVKSIDQILQGGMEVMLRVLPVLHEKFGYSLDIHDIHEGYSMGQLEQKKRLLIERLEKEGLFDLNSSLPFPAVIQNIAVISNEQAAGYHDFIQQINNNPYGYAFDVHLWSSKVQGVGASEELVQAIKDINNSHYQYEIIVIVRGGGSKLDLLAFDEESLARAISQSKLPVVTGVGHETDTSIADLAAARNVKTPTAAAEFVINHNVNFESHISGPVGGNHHACSLLD